ncbi:fluoride efflux transporter CrcB [Calothrix sp. FACHB-1219]|uniref:fluoride efflux transporter CrcB n=1 Tax=unclassified Calothrix TaxID=2619626 RepID=UPI001689C01A|nr:MULTISPECIES: fluoride efflux transporter CrcB [unclassified Calothrix]MBD2208073.1 fluoride efflux transporter CrcB [Calothrix sp. FACHB-168]MBD2217201.1 fluoride efflux transporter CrcB [Calothrix sp. FACHB-1219]
MLPNVTLLGLLAIALGAIPGAVSRYYLTEFCKRYLGTNFPYGTFIINFTGCLIMGFCFTLFQGIKGFPSEIDLLIRTGFLGAYTTFSTYGYDTLTLWSNRQQGATIFYWAGSAILAVVGIILGNNLAQIILGLYN